ncbi:type 1 fimbrial protein, partial [Shigella boydii]
DCCQTGQFSQDVADGALTYSARLKSTQKSVNPGLVRASATFTLEFQ